MSDLAKWKVHGPVRTLRTEAATWDLNTEAWQPVQHYTTTSFRADGKISATDTYNPDGSIAHMRWLYNDAGRLTESNSWMSDEPISSRAVYFYDQAGRHLRTVQLGQEGTETDSEICTYDAEGNRTKVQLLVLTEAHTSYGIEGTDMGWSAPGATGMTTTYDNRDLPTKVLFRDAGDNPLRYVTLTRESAGRLLNVELNLGGEPLFQDIADKTPAEERRGMASMLKQIFGETFSNTTRVYDSRGRMIEQTHRMGTLGGDRTTYRYDEDHDDPIEETTEHTSREADIDEHGVVNYSPDRVSIQHNRFDYAYDGHGNWIERIVSIRPEPDSAFQRSNIERRAIIYHASPSSPLYS
jgi:hypothetical protein